MTDKNKQKSLEKYDIFIQGDDGHIYHVERKQWQSEANRVDPQNCEPWPVLSTLVKSGAVVAEIPRDPLSIGVGVVCTLVNLKALKVEDC